MSLVAGLKMGEILKSTGLKSEGSLYVGPGIVHLSDFPTIRSYCRFSNGEVLCHIAFVVCISL